MGNILNAIENIVDFLENAWTSFTGVFSDIDFTILYNWLPSDIQAAIGAVIAVLLVIAVIQLVKKVILFLG